MALAAAGARVTHVDGSRPAIGWARENAALNGVSTIRWIHEDARRFVDRERRRGLATTGCCSTRPPSGAARPATGSSTVTSAASSRPPSRCSAGAGLRAAERLHRRRDAGDVERLLAWALDARPDGGGLGPIEADTLLLTADGRGRCRPASTPAPQPS